MATTDVVPDGVDAPTRRGLLGLLQVMSRPSLLAFAVGIVSFAVAAFTFAAVTGVVPFRLNKPTFIALMLLNGGLILTLAGLIAWRLLRLWRERLAGMAGARLHVRFVVMFAAITLVPAILVAVFAAVTLNLGIEAWFSSRVKDALGSAVNVAHRFEKSQEDLIVADVYQIANGIERDPQIFADGHVDEALLFTKLATMTKDRGLQASYILDSSGQILGSTKQRSLPDQKPPSADALEQVAHGKVIIDASSKIGVVRALIHLQALKDANLLVVRAIDPAVLGYYQRTMSAVEEYNHLDESRSDIQRIFVELYAVVLALILLSAIWLGLWAANTMVRPISRLIGAAERVSGGDLKSQVPVERDDDEIGTLGRAFNRMMAELDAQRSDLIDASRQIDIRRRFTEAVLSGVSAGVIGLDGDGNITIVNRAAARLLNVAPEEVEGHHYSEAVPELGALIRKAIAEPVSRASGEASVKRGGKTRTLSVQVDSEKGDVGFVVTFDDITDLVSAQRTAAWADVARRIAHEIKNPLTPIQLSAERLKRKYGREVVTDPEIFEQCTDTIIRQVGDIGRMVDEFSSFARMPAPMMKREHVQDLVQQAVFLQRVANPAIAFETKSPPEPVYAECDGRLVSQALTNVLKNATEAIAAREATGDETPGRIAIALESRDDRLTIRIADNGIGLPAEHRHRLTEPYVTTRAKGTGLGLAIVRKIFEDHGGDIALSDLGEDERGAEVRLTFPIKQKPVRDAQHVGVGV
ncbi:MAG: PAS domain-containing sensor histidine kinase [Proteobacteria bacterium]|nr:PAS domain-containing sensor histidine kinase [Pseudomonadota bacterium]